MKATVLVVIMATCVGLSWSIPYPSKVKEGQKKTSTLNTLITLLHDAMVQDYEEANTEQLGGFQIATAVVSNVACMIDNCCEYVGQSATGEANGCTPLDCAEAEGQAIASLDVMIPDDCSRFVTTSCQKHFCN